MKRLFSLILAGALAFAIAVPAQAQTAVTQSLQNLTNKADTYTVSTAVTLATSPTDFFVLTGSATKTIYVKSATVSCVQTTGANNQVIIAKRSTANTGGTSTTLTPTSHDSASVAATAVPIVWTANPTLGTGVSLILQYIPFPAPGTITDVRPLSFTWGEKQDQYVVLRGVAQSFAVYLKSQTTTGGICSVSVSWMER